MQASTRYYLYYYLQSVDVECLWSLTEDSAPSHEPTSKIRAVCILMEAIESEISTKPTLMESSSSFHKFAKIPITLFGWGF